MEEPQSYEVDELALAKRAIELRKEGELNPIQVAQQVSKEFDIPLPIFSMAYKEAVRLHYDELSEISDLPLVAHFKVFAKNKHGEEKQVGIVEASKDQVIDVFFHRANPFFFDKEDCRVEIIQDPKELEV